MFLMPLNSPSSCWLCVNPQFAVSHRRGALGLPRTGFSQAGSTGAQLVPDHVDM